jgi:putative phosphoesterase
MALSFHFDWLIPDFWTGLSEIEGPSALTFSRLIFDRQGKFDENKKIMRIGLISDTHIPWERSELPPQVIEAFQGVDLILHAGDIYAHSVLDHLEQIAPVLAALGDDDYNRPDPRVQEKHVLKLEGLTLWLIHERPYILDPNGKPDIIVFGHEHRTVLERSGEVFHINSGSPTFLNYRRGLGTVAILEINSGRAEAKIIQL